MPAILVGMAVPVPTRSTASPAHARQDRRNCAVKQVTSSVGSRFQPQCFARAKLAADIFAIHDIPKLRRERCVEFTRVQHCG